MKSQQLINTKQVESKGAAQPAAAPSHSQGAATLDPYLRLERLVGNRAAGRLLQAKLRVSAPGDEYEREADRVADQVVNSNTTAQVTGRVGEAHAQRACRQCEDEEEQHGTRSGATLQRKESGGNGDSAVALGVGARESRLDPSVPPSNEGEPLGTSVRAYFEPKFGRDLSRVRVHTNSRAADAAQAVNALAYTVGGDVVFGGGQYAPESFEGRRLLAHELTHVVQQGGDATAPRAASILDSSTGGAHEAAAFASSEAVRDAMPNQVRERAPLAIARQENKDAAPGTSVSLVEISLVGDKKIDFHTTTGMYRYSLEETGLIANDYDATVTVDGNTVYFTLNGMAGDFNFSWEVKPGQPNPATFFANQTSVAFHIKDAEATPLAPQSPEKKESGPNVLTLTPEEAMARCESGDLPGIMTFPFRSTRFGGAPVSAHREGDEIVVKLPVHVFSNDDFNKQTRTLPTEAFIEGVHLKPNQLVRVHVYEPHWYQPNITGSTEGDKEREFCATGEQMLQIADASTTATMMNVGITVIEGASFFIPVGEIASFVAKPLIGGARTLTAATMIGMTDVAPAAFGGSMVRAGTTVVEEQLVTEVAGQTLTRSVSQTVVNTAGEGVLDRAAPALAADVAAPNVAAAAAPEVAGTGAGTVIADVAGGVVKPIVTPPPGAPPIVPPSSVPVPVPPSPTAGVMLTTVTGDQVIVDTNIAIAVDKAAQGLPLHAGEKLMLEAAKKQGIIVTEKTVEELGAKGGAQSTARMATQVTASDAEKQAIIAELEAKSVGGGAADRQIVQQALLSNTAPGVTPTLATADRGVINGLARIAGIDPARLGKYRTVAEYLFYTRKTDTFEVVINGRRLYVKAVQAIREGL